MNPETITTSQILKSLTPKHVATIVSTTIAVCAAIAYGGFWVGQQIAESKSLVQQAELRAATAQVQAKLEVAQAQLQASVAASAQMKELLERSQKTVEDKNNEIAKLNEALGRSNNCAFVHQQIIDTKQEMEGTGSGAGLSRGRAGIATKMRYACGIPRQGFHRRRIPDAMPQRQHTA